MPQSPEVGEMVLEQGENRSGSEEVRRKMEELKAAIKAQKSKENDG